METIWAPWRIKYILGKKSGSCIFCYKISKDYKRKNLILYEGSHCLVIMNKYPYAPGHLMVIPKRHLKELGELTSDETVDLFDLVKLGISAVQKALNPHGFNIGANLGRLLELVKMGTFTSILWPAGTGRQLHADYWQNKRHIRAS